MSGSVRSRMPLRLLLSSITGWRTTPPCIPIPGWAIAHLGSTSFPNPLRVRFDGVNSTGASRDSIGLENLSLDRRLRSRPGFHELFTMHPHGYSTNCAGLLGRALV